MNECLDSVSVCSVNIPETELHLQLNKVVLPTSSDKPNNAENPGIQTVKIRQIPSQSEISIQCQSPLQAGHGYPDTFSKSSSDAKATNKHVISDKEHATLKLGEEEPTSPPSPLNLSERVSPIRLGTQNLW